MNVFDLQRLLEQTQFSGWLFYDFRHSNPIAYRALGLDEQATATRRWYYLVPKSGSPKKLVSAIEPSLLDSIPGEKRLYRTWQEREDGLAEILEGQTLVATEYSPRNAIPYVSLVDAGTIELVRSLGCDVGSSANLVQQAVARWSGDQLRQHVEASRRLMVIKDATFAAIRQLVTNGQHVTDVAVQQFMAGRMQEAELVFDHPPIVATNFNSSNPHFEPVATRPTSILPGDLILIDFWAKLAQPGAVYADYTWIAYLGAETPDRYARVFAVVAEARDAAIAYVKNNAAAGRTMLGYEVDHAARAVIDRHGFGDYFIHRTGHNIGQDVHGEGANLDDYEIHDERALLPGTCFSIEPGIYLPDFGIRSEVDVYLAGTDAVVTGEIQRSILSLLA